MEQIIYLLTAIIYGIFIIRFILSWIGGDFDFDSEFDLGDIVSFKGATHFLMGLLGWLSVKLWIVHYIMWYDYLIAFIIGIIFVGILYFVYKLMMSLETKPRVKSGRELIGQNAKIYLCIGYDSEGMYTYEITTENGIGTIECPAKSNQKYAVGDSVIINDLINAYYII